jgi:hypothetical protein
MGEICHTSIPLRHFRFCLILLLLLCKVYGLLTTRNLRHGICDTASYDLRLGGALYMLRFSRLLLIGVVSQCNQTCVYTFSNAFAAL